MLVLFFIFGLVWGNKYYFVLKYCIYYVSFKVIEFN